MSAHPFKIATTGDLRVNLSVTPTKIEDANRGENGKTVAAEGVALPQIEAASSVEKVEEAVNQMNEFVQNLSRDLQFTVDRDSGRTIIKVLDSETQEVIRQIPPEELLQIASQLTESGGLLLRVQA